MEISAEDRGLINKHLELVLKANEITNLTRISSYEEGQLLHVEDSLTGLPEIMQAHDGKYADLGTGGGFPGIPLAVVTKRETLLVDAVRKKTDVLDHIIKELGLQDYVSTYHGRIEDLGRERAGEFAVITARALTQLVSLLELAAPLLQLGGHLICYKAKLDSEELETALAIQKMVGMKLLRKNEFMLADNQRCILTFEKVSDPQIKLPRKSGLAQKRPLVSK